MNHQISQIRQQFGHDNSKRQSQMAGWIAAGVDRKKLQETILTRAKIPADQSTSAIVEPVAIRPRGQPRVWGVKDDCPQILLYNGIRPPH